MPAIEKKRRAMSAAALNLVAARFRVLGEPSRLKLLIELEQGEKCVSELSKATGLTQANVSRHLHALMESGILARRKAGLQVFYTIADPTIFEMCDHVCGSLAARMKSQASFFKKI
jgi:DNA-binding transcriptional ArsR family regulator